MAKAKTSMNMMAAALEAPKGEAAKKPVDGVKATPPGRAKEASATAGTETAATTTTPAAAAPAKPKKPEGPVPIETNQQLLKAIWSSRGNIWLTTPDFPVPIAVVKSSLTDHLKNAATPGDPAPYDLVPRKNGDGTIDTHNSDLVPMGSKTK